LVCLLVGSEHVSETVWSLSYFVGTEIWWSDSRLRDQVDSHHINIYCPPLTLQITTFGRIVPQNKRNPPGWAEFHWDKWEMTTLFDL
jgi:hypothetical protein